MSWILNHSWFFDTLSYQYSWYLPGIINIAKEKLQMRCSLKNIINKKITLIKQKFFPQPDFDLFSPYTYVHCGYLRHSSILWYTELELVYLFKFVGLLFSLSFFRNSPYMFFPKIIQSVFLTTCSFITFTKFRKLLNPCKSLDK